MRNRKEKNHCSVSPVEPPFHYGYFTVIIASNIAESFRLYTKDRFPIWKLLVHSCLTKSKEFKGKTKTGGRQDEKIAQLGQWDLNKNI